MQSSALATAATVIAVLLMALPEARGIQCYECNSRKDPGCESLKRLTPNTTGDPRYLHECKSGPQGEEPFCRNSLIKVLYANEGKGEERWVRSCGWVKYKYECYMNDDGDHTENVCQCFTDGCNSAPVSAHAAAAWYLLLLPALLQALLLAALQAPR